MALSLYGCKKNHPEGDGNLITIPLPKNLFPTSMQKESPKRGWQLFSASRHTSLIYQSDAKRITQKGMATLKSSTSLFGDTPIGCRKNHPKGDGNLQIRDRGVLLYIFRCRKNHPKGDGNRSLGSKTATNFAG